MDRRAAVVALTLCGIVAGCSDATRDEARDAGRDAVSADRHTDRDGGIAGNFRGFVGITQSFPDETSDPMAQAYQSFVLELPCTGNSSASLCGVTATANECGGTTFYGSGYFGRAGAGFFATFWGPPFDAGRIQQTFISPGDVRIEGEHDGLTIPANESTASAAVLFEPLETLRVAATGDVVPSFETAIQMPQRVSFSAPRFPESPFVMANEPIDVAWTSDGSVGTVEVWSAAAFTPDAASMIDVAHCSAPLGAGHLTVPAHPRYMTDASVFSTRVLSIRVENTVHLQVGGWDIQVTAASFNAITAFVYPPADAGTDAL